jgi:hypothetical protein
MGNRSLSCRLWTNAIVRRGARPACDGRLREDRAWLLHASCCHGEVVIAWHQEQSRPASSPRCSLAIRPGVRWSLFRVVDRTGSDILVVDKYGSEP